MFIITKEAAELFKEGALQSVRIKVDPLVGESFELTQADIVSNGFRLNRASITGDCIELGSVIAAELMLNLNNSESKFDSVCFEGASLFVRVGVHKPGTENELYFVPFGYFTVDDAPKSLSSIPVVALDRMMRFDKKAENIVFPIKVKDLVQKACDDCNVPLGTDLTDLPNSDYVIDKAPQSDNLLYRQLLSWCAQIMGTCAFINSDGKLILKWYTPTDVEITASDRFSSSLDENAITITGIEFSDEENVYLSGTEDYAIDITGNQLIQSNPQGVVDNLFSAIGGFSYVPFSAVVKSHPQLMPLDMITFVVPGKTEEDEDVRHNVIITDWTFTLNRNTSLLGQGKTSTKKGYASSNPFTSAQSAIIEKNKEKQEKELSRSQQAMTNLGETISNAFGLYATEEKQEDGSTVYYYHNKESIDESTYIFTKNAEGFAFVKSEDGTPCWNNGNPIWQYGVTNDGNAILNYLVLNKLSAQHIDVNSLFAENITAKNEIKSEAMTEDLPKLFINMDKGTIELSYKKDGKIIRTFINEGAITLNNLSSTDGTTSLNLTALTAFGLYTGLISCSEFVGKTFELSDGNTVAVAYGGTGATTAADARKNLGAAEDAKAVQQGGKAYKAPHKIHLDWDDSSLQLQVDETSLGAVAMRGDIVDEIVTTRNTVCSGVTIEPGKNHSVNFTVDKAGYKPLGIVGYNTDGDWATFASIPELYLSSQSTTGSAIVKAIIRNTEASHNVTSFKLEVCILWVKA